MSRNDSHDGVGFESKLFVQEGERVGTIDEAVETMKDFVVFYVVLSSFVRQSFAPDKHAFVIFVENVLAFIKPLNILTVSSFCQSFGLGVSFTLVI